MRKPVVFFHQYRFISTFVLCYLNGVMTNLCSFYMSSVMRKPFAYEKNKADKLHGNREADLHLC